MANVWAFGEERRHHRTYADGTVVPSLEVPVMFNGAEVGHIEVHMHRRSGPDKQPDVSFGATFVAYGPPNVAKDRW